MKLSINNIYYLPIIHYLLWSIFLPYTYWEIKFVYVGVYGQLLSKVLLRVILSMICHIDLKLASLAFYKQRIQPTKYQHLGNVHWTLNYITVMIQRLSVGEKHFSLLFQKYLRKLFFIKFSFVIHKKFGVLL